MQLLKNTPIFSVENKLRNDLIKTLRPCVRFYDACDAEDFIKETYEALKEFLELLQSPREINEWKHNVVSFYDVCDAYYEQVWLPFYKEYINGLTDDELQFHYNEIAQFQYTIIDVHHKDDTYRSTYGYTK